MLADGILAGLLMIGAAGEAQLHCATSASRSRAMTHHALVLAVT